MAGEVALPSGRSTLDVLGQKGAIQVLDAPLVDSKHLLRSY